MTPLQGAGSFIFPTARSEEEILSRAKDVKVNKFETRNSILESEIHLWSQSRKIAEEERHALVIYDKRRTDLNHSR
jgi:hypothetical protein